MADPPTDAAPVACVIGDTDLVRPLARAGIRCAVLAEPGEPVRYSRHVVERLDLPDSWHEPERLVDELCAFAERQPHRPVLYYQGDGELLAISRHRRRLAPFFRFVIADQDLVEDLVDKARFDRLARRLRLPVPPTVVLEPSRSKPSTLPIRFPAIVKPATRDAHKWQPHAGQTKGIRVDDADQLWNRWSDLRTRDCPVLVQELIEGPESRIESYHVLVDESGTVVADFTGVKIRTRPDTFGYTTSLTITDEADVRALGRSVVEATGLTGVAKLDFKRADDGELFLLEINPRFNLWHNPGAVAGVNLPALVYALLVDGSAPATMPLARAGVTWCRALGDALANRSQGESTLEWLRWAAHCDAIRNVALDDPGPALGFVVKSAKKAVHRVV